MAALYWAFVGIGEARAALPSASITAVVTHDALPVSGQLSDLSDSTWASATVLDKFTDLNTRTGDPNTAVHLIFGQTALFCAFVVQQKSGSIIATQKGNNISLGSDDYVGLAFDTSTNGSNTYVFETTPLGTRYQSSSESDRYDPTWLAKASSKSRSWYAEIVVPYSVLKVPQRPGGQWRINFIRYEAYSQHLLTWAYAGSMTSALDTTFWPKVVEVPAIASGKGPANAEIYGLANFGGNSIDSATTSAGIVQASNRHTGVDLNVPLTSGLNFVGTLDPDFSNVESDQAITAPQEFKRQLFEYRPFFTQGATFLPGSEIFYSPSIGAFTRGEKIEGLSGPFGIGVLNLAGSNVSSTAYQLAYTSLDQAITANYAGTQGASDLSHDWVNEGSASYTNLKSRLSLGAAFAHDQGSGTGRSANRSYLYLGTSRANFQLSGTYLDVGPHYNPLYAYVPISDIRGPSISATINSTEHPRSSIRDSSISISADRFVDRSGSVHEADSSVSASLLFRNLVGFNLGTNVSSLRAYAQPYPTYDSGVTQAYNLRHLSVSYLSGTPSAVFLSYSSGPYSTYFLHEFDFGIQHRLGNTTSLSYLYEQNLEQPILGAVDGQILQRASIFKTFGVDENIGLSYRLVHGSGGFSTPGANLSSIYRHRFTSGSNLYVEFGSPAAIATLNRVIVKYVLLVGKGAGE